MQFMTANPSSERHESRRKGLGCATVLVGLLALFILAPSFREREGFVHVQMKKAQKLCELLKTYAVSHQGSYPEKLEAPKISENYKNEAVPDLLTIDLEDGKPLRQWYYHEGLDAKSSLNEWVLISPVLLNANISDSERNWRRWKGGIQPPPPTPWRIVFRKDGSGEASLRRNFTWQFNITSG